MWHDLVHEKDKHGEWRINRINYELCVLEALRDALRCRELWVVGADKYRNPEDDLPKDFEENKPGGRLVREEHRRRRRIPPE